MKNFLINQKLNRGEDATLLLKDPEVHNSEKHSFLPHICGSIFFEKLNFEQKENRLDVHVIALKNSPRIYDFFCEYNLRYVPHIFKGINAKSSDFDHKKYKETQGVAPRKGKGKSHLGCTLSHFYLWKKLKDSENDFHLILEDDAFFCNYAVKALDYLIANIPYDADLIFVNGRASEKLYAGCKYVDGAYTNIPNKMIFSRKEMLALMRDNYQFLRKNVKNGRTTLFSGTDGYILTKSGVKKLNDYVEKYGMEGLPGSGSNNVDMILTAITTDISDHQKIEMAYDIKRRIKNGSISDKPIINSYVCSFPLVDSLQRAGINIRNDNKINNQVTNKDITLISNSAKNLENFDAMQAYKLIALASKLNPSNSFFSSEKKRMKDNVNFHWSKLQPRLQVNEESKFFFVHIPKTGGTSIDDSNLFESPRYGHAGLKRFKKLLGNDYYSYKCFTLVRNPWDRLASAFYYISEGGSGNKIDLKVKNQYIGKFNGNFKEFLINFIDNSGIYLNLLHFKPMKKFFNPEECNLDFYIQKLEYIKDLQGLNNFLGSDLIMPHNRKRKDYSNVIQTYNKDLFSRVRDIFLDDIVTFGYESFTIEDIKN